MKINLTKMKEKMFHTPRNFAAFCKDLENHSKTTQVNFRGQYYDWTWYVEFESLNLVVTSVDNRQSGVRSFLTFRKMYEDKQ